MIPNTTSGSMCPYCGQHYAVGMHGLGYCYFQPLHVPQPPVTTYIGVTPEQVRQIVRDEIAAAGNRMLAVIENYEARWGFKP